MASRKPFKNHGGRSTQGFTLIEVLIATALLGFSLIVMFGFHAQASRSNMHARKITACTYLAQSEMEQLISLEWTGSNWPTELTDAGADVTSATDPWTFLEHPNGGAQPTAVNAVGNTNSALGGLNYFITWDVEYMDEDITWARLRVRCTYRDARFNVYRGTTISSYRYRDAL
jgi:prepilin-type N-terminal cleavage/methylation domain-containing protein